MNHLPRRIVQLTGGITVLLSTAAPAQSPGLSAEFGVAREWALATGSTPAVTVLPVLAYDRGWWRADGGASSGVASAGRPELRVTLGGMVRGPRIGPFGTELAADYVTPTPDVPSANLRTNARIHLSSATRGVWAGLGHARVGAAGTLLASGGGWWSGRRGTLSLRFDDAVGGTRSATETLADTLVVRRGLPTIRTRSALARFVGAEGRVELSVGSMRVDAPGVHGRRDAGAHAVWWFTPIVALTGGYGVPLDGMTFGGRSAARFGMLLRHRPTLPRPSTLTERPAARIMPLGEGRWRIRIPAPGAERVELQGSSTAWEPVALTRAAGGWWEVTLSLPPGRHEFIWRRDDGTWSALPGLPSSADPMLGDVTVVVTGE